MEKKLEETKRKMLFLSHATPEDNGFARWLALQLANEGYPVWCDLTKLLGGEDFWKDIQEAIRENSIRFLFVLSRSSNSKDGTLQELACAKGVASKLKGQIRDFIIALKIDDLPYSDVDIEIQRLNHVPFTSLWAAGLHQLLKKLKEDDVPKDARFNPTAVSTWWRSQAEFSAEQGLLETPEIEISNWYLVTEFPQVLWCHNVSRRTSGKLDFDVSKLAWPAAKVTDLSFVTFASSDEIESYLDKSIYIQSSIPIRTVEVLQKGHPLSRSLVSLVRQAWDKALRESGLSRQEMAPQPNRYYLPKGDQTRVFFDGVQGKRSYRDVVGYATKRGVLRYWHYAISGKAEMLPYPHIVVRGHVLFSDSGLTLWSDAEKSAKARRNQCKGWWNDEWRDRMLAMMSLLKDVDGTIKLPASSTSTIVLSASPETFESSVSYSGEKEVDEVLDDYFDDEDDDEGDEEDDVESAVTHT